MQRYYIPGATPQYVTAGQAFRTVDGISHPKNALIIWTEAERTAIGAVPKPALQDHERVIEGAEGWVVEDKPLADYKGERQDEVEDEYARRIGAGYAHDFGMAEAILENGTVVAAGIQTLQMRGLEDKTNWQLSLTQANEYIAAGSPEKIELRAESNARISLPAVEAKAVLMALLNWGNLNMKNKWNLKDSITRKATRAEVEAVDTTAGWTP